MTETINLLLSEVQQFEPNEFRRCRVHFDGFAKKGRDGEYRTGGAPFEYEISPQQANLLSRLQDRYGGWRLSSQEEALIESVPPELTGKWKAETHVTSRAQVALYDLLK